MKPLYWTRILAAPAPTSPTAPSPADITPSSPTALTRSPSSEGLSSSLPISAPPSPLQSPDETDAHTSSTSASPPIPPPPSAINAFGASGPAVTPTTPPGLWHQIDETPLENLPEFTDLFSRRATVPPGAGSRNGGEAAAAGRRRTKVQTVKVLDSKRSQSVGIFARSLHVDFAEIEHAIYHCDTSVVSLEQLTQMMEMKATAEELLAIQEAAAGEAPLDAPEEFLLRIAQFSYSAERIACIVFQVGEVRLLRFIDFVKIDVKIEFSLVDQKVFFTYHENVHSN